MAASRQLRKMASAHEATTACYVGSSGQNPAGIPMDALQRALSNGRSRAWSGKMACPALLTNAKRLREIVLKSINKLERADESS
jgi:hypothetical protein